MSTLAASRTRASTAGRDIDDAAERGEHRDAPAREVVRAEPGFPAADAWQAGRVARVVARAHVEVARRVAHRAGEVPEHDGVRDGRTPAATGGYGRRCPSSRADRCSPRGYGSSRRRHRRSRAVTRPPATAADAARRRPADGAAVLPRVVGHAVELGDAHVEAAELARGREPDTDGAAVVEQARRRRSTSSSRRGRGTRASLRSPAIRRPARAP